MIPYRVFRQDAEGVLHYDASSCSLGAGVRELELIVDGHQLRAGDVIEIDGQWLIYLGEGLSPFLYLPAYETDGFRFGDGFWSPHMKARLQHEAGLCETMTEDAQKRARSER